ncbi:hypothetical protein [Sporosalibacterium faouarense]|uniref:hypothetical protein n=1 Tax=Sporosalibacterium faouarense TaxID=516123 RepID=UPI00141C9039|nr:hypothetical protein [Sporosalibacterium faouarense]MTI49581.1 hypothetical protein [Bacillota bacterium]
MKKKSTYGFLILFTILIILFIICFIIKNQIYFIYNTAFIYIGYLLLTYFEIKGKVKITSIVNYFIFFIVILHLGFGQYLNLYNTNHFFDKILHVIGSFTISILFYQILTSFFTWKANSKILTFIFVISIGITIGVFLEILEFGLDSIFNAHNQHGLLDTDLDMLSNILGSSVAGVYLIVK